MTPAPGDPDYSGHTWIELLEALLNEVDEPHKQTFLRDIKRRLPGVQMDVRRGLLELLKYYDRLQLAWFFQDFFDIPGERDSTIASIVNPGRSGTQTRTSLLFQELLDLPFSDIVTTNYDDNIEYFLQQSGKTPVHTIISMSDLADPKKEDTRHRLFYLHGKAGGPSPLVLDRFDYARLLAERDGLFDYITFLARTHHVVYIGFGLDDPTFNMLETRLHSLHGPSRPESWAFIPETMEIEQNMWKGRNLKIVDYGHYDNLPKLLGCASRIVRFIRWAEPNRPEGSLRNTDRTRQYTRRGLDRYSNGDYEESEQFFRAALASTLFWNRDTEGKSDTATTGETNEPTDLPISRLITRCDIRFRLALNHYKLLYVRNEDERTRHREALKENLDAGDELLAALDRQQKTAKEEDLLGALAVRLSIEVLKARQTYHAGQWKEAKQKYDSVIQVGERELSKSSAVSVPVDAKSSWLLRIKETVSYAQCQRSRIAYQLCDQEESLQESKKLIGIADNIKEIVDSQVSPQSSHDAGIGVPYFSRSFAAIWQIALWTAGRHDQNVFAEMIPRKDERTPENTTRLEEAIRHLRIEIPTAASWCQEWVASPRWRALKHRYLSRALATRWFIGRFSLDSNPQRKETHLSDAYTELQEAFRITNEPGLERQRILILLEAARLNILVVLAERLRQARGHGGIPSDLVSPLSYTAAVRHLESAFLAIDCNESPMKSEWIRVIAHRTAGWLWLVAREKIGEDKVDSTSTSFSAILKAQTKDAIIKSVADQYAAFAGGDQQMIEAVRIRVERFENAVKAVEGELYPRPSPVAT